MKTFKQFINEFGPGYSPTRGSSRYDDNDEYDGEWNGRSVHVEFYGAEKDEVKKRAKELNVKLVKSELKDKTIEILGSKANVKKFLMASGWNSSDLRKWYGL